MEFDPVSSAQFIPAMIENDTLIEFLDPDQLSECLKHITLNANQSLYILNRVQSKYNVTDRFKAFRHLFTDFGEGINFDSEKFVEFIKTLSRVLHFEILDLIADIFSSKLNKESKKLHIRTKAQIRSLLQSQTQRSNKNIEALKKISKSEDNFDKIYQVFEQIATEDDLSAMSFAVKEKYCYVTQKDKDGKTIFTKAASDNKQDMVRLLIESDIDANSKDKTKSTALMLASWNCHQEIVELLLSVPGIDVNAKDKYNETALMKASWSNHDEITKLLEARGAQ